MEFGLFVALVSQLKHLTYTITSFIPYTITSMSEHIFYCNDVEKFFNLPNKVEGNTWIHEDFDTLEFQNVTFSYPNTKIPVLTNVSFTLRKNEKLAIVGENGAGKTTVIKLILGLYTPDAGVITVNNFNINELSSASRKKFFSAVFQDFYQYNLTVRENIGIGDIANMNNDSDILEAASQGNADKLIQTIGIDTHLGKIYESGTDLSFGQWQSLAISRGVFSNSKIIILDEPTAAIDPEAEAKIYHSFIKSAENKSCIMISHRLGSTRFANRILVFKDGRIIENGTHDELMVKRGHYKYMFDSQAKQYCEVKAK